jgi:hypothetical protein
MIVHGKMPLQGVELLSAESGVSAIAIPKTNSVAELQNAF